MHVVIDVEANSLSNPDKIHLIVCKDIDTGQFHIFRNITSDEHEKERFLEFAKKVDLWIGHNILGYDFPVLFAILHPFIEDVAGKSCDTLIISKLVDYPRQEHSVEDYGNEFGYPKGDNSGPGFFSKWSKELEQYCVQDVEICHKIYLKYIKYINNPDHRRSILLEHRFQLIVNDLHDNGFSFNADKAQKLLDKVTAELQKLDVDIEKAFPPREVLIREFTPKATKFGTISKTSVPRSLHDQIHLYEVGKTYQHTKLEPFNPSSHKQIIEVLHNAGWSPVEKTTTHIECERELNRLKRDRGNDNSLDIAELSGKLVGYGKYGWKVNEANLATLPDKAPAPARFLAKRILLESRRRTLTEWLGLVDPSSSRIHGSFYAIGAWTHRMAHQRPNTANIPNEFDTNGKVKLLGKEMRQLWRAPKNRLLVGVDAEGIQLRIFAHYINDEEFTNALVHGKKSDKSDPHSLNQRILGEVCKSRQAAKRYIYALLLGAGHDKLAAILECGKTDAELAYDNLIGRYGGFSELKRTIIPADAKRGWFIGLDGRKVRIPGDTTGERKHLCMSGYLQSGEAIVMKAATLRWYEKLKEVKELDWKLVNFVHDEWQTEVNNNMDLALLVAKSQADALREVGEELGLLCPLAGSYWNDDHHDYTIGTNWYQTH